MSKVGKAPIALGSSITLTDSGKIVRVTGPKGEATVSKPDGITLVISEGSAQVSAENKIDKKIRSLFGMFRANLANAVKGVDSGFEKKLEMKGVGYRAQMQGPELVLSVGFSHPVKFTPPQGVSLSVTDNVISVAGIDKVLIGEMAARIRKVRKPEPYKGKGIMYQGEHVRRKAGKAAKAAGAAGAK